MPIAYQDLNPTESEIEFNSVVFKLRKFDLAAQAWAHTYFATDKEPNGIRVLSERIQNIDDFSAVIDVVWHLLKKKAHFANRPELFSKAIENLGQEKYLKTMEFRVAINECLGASQPKPEEFKGDIELKKSLAVDNLKVKRPALQSSMICSPKGMATRLMNFMRSLFGKFFTLKKL